MIRSIYELTHAELQQVARDQADAGERCSHGYAPNSPQAVSYELAYLERRMELAPGVMA